MAKKCFVKHFLEGWPKIIRQLEVLIQNNYIYYNYFYYNYFYSTFSIPPNNFHLPNIAINIDPSLSNMYFTLTDVYDVL